MIHNLLTPHMEKLMAMSQYETLRPDILLGCGWHHDTAGLTVEQIDERMKVDPLNRAYAHPNACFKLQLQSGHDDIGQPGYEQWNSYWRVYNSAGELGRMLTVGDLVNLFLALTLKL
jgi:hypothetical protein